jgi:hypothetical protein
MKDLVMEGGKIRPGVRFKSHEGIIDLYGRSLMEYAEDVFDPMYKWLEEYSKNPREETTINLALEYFNSTTSKALIRFLLIAKKLTEKYRLTINYFYYDDESLYEEGKDFSEVMDFPFNFIEKKIY